MKFAALLLLVTAACAETPDSSDPMIMEAVKEWRAAGGPALQACPYFEIQIMKDGDCPLPACDTGASPCAWACTIAPYSGSPQVYRQATEAPGHSAQHEVTHEAFHIWSACMFGDADASHKNGMWASINP
jgi:hypothetical protein